MCKLLGVIFTVMLVITFPVLSDSNDDSVKNQIVIPLNEWSSQRVLSHVVGRLIQREGVEVTYQNISSADQWGALRKGIVHLQIEVWQPSMNEEFNKMLAHNFILDLGTHSAVVREDWWYPEYVEKYCPELPNWQALNKCAHLFSNKYLGSKGTFYTGPWNYYDADLIRALNLNFSIKRLTNETVLWEKLNNAMVEKKPIILVNWTPNWTDLSIKGKFVEFPEYTADCESDPQWGINKNLAKDCGNIKRGWLKKAAWVGLKERWPCAYLLMKKINLNNEMISYASSLVVVDGYSEEEAANLWINKYHSNIQAWLDFQCKASLQ